MTHYTRLALDIGTTSIGWALLKTDENGEPYGVVRTGVRIFSSGRDDKTDAPLNQKRQKARSARRRQDRIVQRKKALMKYLIQYGFMPENESERKKLELLNPYQVRRDALYEQLPLYHMGRAFFHINQGRGFKSNRKQQGDNKEGGAIKSAIETTEQLLMKKTIGEYLYIRQQNGDHVRTRNISDKTNSFAFDFYRQRDMLESEFDKIWHAQKEYNPTVYTDAAYKTIREVIFNQRPLKTKQEHIGRCTLFPDEYRASKALPIYQNFRIVQDMVNLAYIDPQGYDHKIITKCPEVFKTIYETLASGKNQSFTQIKKLLFKKEIIGDVRWQLNFESDTRKGFDRNKVAYVLSAKKNAPLQGVWDTWSLDEQTALIKLLLDESKEDSEVLDILKNTYELNEKTAEQVLNIPLPSGYSNLCEQALNDLHPIMLYQGLRYDMAVTEAYPDKHDDFKGEGKCDNLPYYAQELQEHCTGGHNDPTKDMQRLSKHLQDIQKYGRIANPTVHIGLVQLQAVVNDIIRIHGKPTHATVEFARDLKNNKKQKDAINKKQKENRENNDKWAKEIAEIAKSQNIVLKNDRENRLRMRLWNELDWDNINNRACPYTGIQISKTMLFSDEVEIEHILPYACSLDDSPNNKTLSMRYANRFKGNKTPYEAFGQNPDSYDWDAIYTRAQHLPKSKTWRFAPNAMEKLEEKQTVQDRQLNDTRYLSKVARKYLGLIIPENNIHVIPGQLTAMLRGKWGLNETLYKKDPNVLNDTTIFAKNRNDHRHHAVDAVVIGCTTRGMLQRVATLSGQNLDNEKKMLSGFEPPWENFRTDVEQSVSEIVISHKPDPYPQGQLHEETFYGKTNKVLKDKKGNETEKQQYVIRKDITYFDNENKINEIRDPLIRQDLLERFNFADRPKDWLQQFTKDTGIRKLRILTEKPNLIKIGTKYVKGGNNWAVDIYTDPKNPEKWQGEVIQGFYANKKDFIPQWKQDNPEFKRIMRLQKNDLVSMEFDGQRHVMRLCKIDSTSAIHFALHSESNVPSRKQDLKTQGKYKQSSVSSLQKMDIQKVHISPSGLWQEKPIK